MAGKKRTPEAPSWFRPDAYRPAEFLDRGDWLLNLSLRCWLYAHPEPTTEVALRECGPVLRRGDTAQIKAMHLADKHRWVYSFSPDQWGGDLAVFEAFDEACKRPAMPPDVWHALRHGVVKGGIDPLSVAALYLFERRLPEDVRAAGARFKAGDSESLYPRGFRGTLDDAFGPGPGHQMTSRFARIDLTLPDDVLHADLKRYLGAERRRLAAMGGRQHYREAASLKLKAHELRTLASDGLLPFLDLDRWQRAEGLKLTFHAVRETANIDRSREVSLRRRVALALNQMQLHAWFARLERSAKVAARMRRSSQ